MQGNELRYYLRPNGVQASGQEHRIELSDVDQLMPPVLVSYCFVYAPSPETVELRRELCDKLCRGLEQALGNFPSLCGTVLKDPDTQRTFVRTGTEDDAVLLKVLGLQSPEVPSYRKLKETKFHTSNFNQQNTVPLSTENPQPALKPCSIFQISFHDGCLLLAAQIHHQVADGISHDMFLSEWSHCCRTSSLSLTPVHDRSLMSAKNKHDSSSSPAELAEKLTSKGVASFFENSPPWSDPNRKKFSSQLYRVKKSSINALKSKVAEHPAGPSIVSTNDCLNALIWQAVMRARLGGTDPEPTDVANFYPVTGFRGRRDIDFPKTYFGNAVTMCPVQMPAYELIQSQSLPIAVRKMREATNRLDATALKDIVDFAGRKDVQGRYLFGFPSGKLDVAVTSWAHLSCFRNYDFGFGLPQGFGRTPLSYEFIMFLPPRDSEDAMEILVSTDEKSQDFLLRDNQAGKVIEPCWVESP